jgi:hypothetical protein
MDSVGHVAHMGDVRNPCKILIEKAAGKRPLGNIVLR